MRKPKRLVVLVALVSVVLLVASSCVLNGSWTALSPAPPTPPPGESVDAEFVSVSCPTADFCMAVGASVADPFGAPAIQTWDGSSWTEVAPPPPPAPGFEVGPAGSVSCLSSVQCFVIVSHFGDGDLFHNIHGWDGSTWTRVPPDTFSNDSPAEVDCAPDGTCMVAAMGIDEFAFFDGTSWEPIPFGSVFGDPGPIGCGAATFCVQTTPWGDVTSWDGSEWDLQGSLPLPAGQDYVSRDIDCTSATHCVAAGLLQPSGEPAVFLWDGQAWTAMPLPVSGAGEIDAVSCASAGECVALGEGSVEALARAGSAWYVIAGPAGNRVHRLHQHQLRAAAMRGGGLRGSGERHRAGGQLLGLDPGVALGGWSRRPREAVCAPIPDGLNEEGGCYPSGVGTPLGQ